MGWWPHELEKYSRHIKLKDKEHMKYENNEIMRDN